MMPTPSVLNLQDWPGREGVSAKPSRRQPFDRLGDRSGIVFVAAAERYATEERFGLGAFLSITGAERPRRRSRRARRSAEERGRSATSLVRLALRRHACGAAAVGVPDAFRVLRLPDRPVHEAGVLRRWLARHRRPRTDSGPCRRGVGSGTGRQAGAPSGEAAFKVHLPTWAEDRRPQGPRGPCSTRCRLTGRRSE